MMQTIRTLHSVEFVHLAAAEQPGINAAWRTLVLDDDGRTLADNVHRRAAVGADIDEILPEIHSVLGEAGLQALTDVADIKAALSARDADLADALQTIAQQAEALNVANARIAYLEAPSPALVQSVSRAKALIALHRAGLSDAVDSYFAVAAPEARIAWQQATEFRRDSPTLAGAAAALGLDEAALDRMFTAAASVTI